METNLHPVAKEKNSYIVPYEGKEYLVQSCDFELFPLDKVVVSRKTEFQEIIIADTPKYGRILFLDGDLQSSEYDEAFYHELLIQPAMVAHKNPERVLVVGTGEGASLREIFKHDSVKEVVAIDIDREVVELCTEHLPTWHHGKMKDPRVRHIFRDGFEYLRECTEEFDVAIIDIVADLEDGPAGELYTPAFYELVKSRLKKDAMVAIQGLILSPVESESRGHRKLRKAVQEVFAHVDSYRGTIPSFLSCWGFILASDWFPVQDLQSERVKARLEQISMEHLDADALQAAFVLDLKTRGFLS